MIRKILSRIRVEKISLSILHRAIDDKWQKQRGNQKSYIEEEHTIQWPIEKRQEDHKTPQRKLKVQQHKPTEKQSELKCPGRMSCFCSTCCTCCVTIETKSIISRLGKVALNFKTLTPTLKYSYLFCLFKEQRIVDFDNLTEYKDTFKDLDTGFCCLGTTKGKSGKVGFIKKWYLLLTILWIQDFVA